jgi:hypothetical protein
VLEPEHGELVRAFVREAALAESAPAWVASLVADDAVEAWQALCTPDAGRERARIELLCSRRDVRARILLDFPTWWHHLRAASAVMPASPAMNTASTDGRSASTAA